MRRSIGGRSDTARISYRHNNSIPANVPFPEDASDIVYDENRPYLRCITGLSIDAALDFFTKGLAPEGWSPLAAPAIQSRYPDAKLVEAADGSKRVYFNRDRRERDYPPVVLTLQRASGDKTVVDLRVASFALPRGSRGSTRSSRAFRRRKATRALARRAARIRPAAKPALCCLQKFRRSLPSTAASWRYATGPSSRARRSIADTTAKVTFVKPDETAILELGQRYDLTTVRLTAQISQAAMAARERAKKEADAQWMRNAVQQAQELSAAADVKRRERDAVAAATPAETLRPLASSPAPIPLPEDAIEIKFDGNRGDLEFRSPSSPKSVAAFYAIRSSRAAGRRAARSSTARRCTGWTSARAARRSA